MTTAQAQESAYEAPLRLWPGVLIVALQWFGWSVLPRLMPGAGLISALCGLGGGLAIAVWWLLFSRARWSERVGAIVLMIAVMLVMPRLLHESVAQGNMGFQFILHAVPVLSLAFVIWAVACRSLADRPRRAALVATIVLACGAFTLVRSDGVTGDGMAEFAWRWSETAEQRLLAQAGEVPAVLTPAAVAAQGEPDWPGLRGPDRDGVVRGLRIETDWSSSPPVELWRRAIGPGVSSFAVRGDLLYTHEQRGEQEVVTCHDVNSGEPLWRHSYAARFWDSHVGAGPRATPALGADRVFTLGATGILNALAADDGTLLWSRDATSDSDGLPPNWGYVSSPLVVDDVVIVAVSGALVAYDVADGQPRWVGPARGGSYSSPQLLTLGGVPQILLMGHQGVFSVAPADGSLLWEHAWPGIGIMQPALTPEGDLLISLVDGGAMPVGTRRLSVARGAGGWSVEERWTSDRLKPSFNDVVVHHGHAFGVDGRILACVDLETGERAWKGGRYGEGQLLLLPDQDLLLVLSETGELALVEATPERFTELARFPAIEGKTWNQPALVNDLLLVRNGQEMAAFRLALAPPMSSSVAPR